jgi:hypothetical protein
MASDNNALCDIMIITLNVTFHIHSRNQFSQYMTPNAISVDSFVSMLIETKNVL